MPDILAFFLGIVQGITEFLPVSSDGHLAVMQIVVGKIYDLEHIPLAYDVFLHFATLLVTLHFLRHEVIDILRRVFRSGPEADHVRRLVYAGIVATLPAACVGLLLEDWFEETFHSLSIAGLGFLVTAVLLETAHRKQLNRVEASAVAESSGRDSSDISTLQVPSLRAALLIGLAQSTALLPGVSRSGTTIASALLLGIDPKSAVRFSFLLALPTVAGAVLLKSREIAALPADYYMPLIIGFFVTLLSGAVAIRLVPIVVTRLKLRYFAIYLIPLAAFCFYMS